MASPQAALDRHNEELFRSPIRRRWLLNPTTLLRRDFDGIIYSTKNSGAHWLRYMLGLILAELHGLEPPEHINSFKIIGHPSRHPPQRPGVPSIVATHSTAHPALRLRPVFALNGRARYLILVRDFRSILVSVYEKYYAASGEPDFTTFLHGNLVDPKAYICDLWELMRFANEWGAVLAKQPARCELVRYEELVAAPEPGLRQICGFLRIEGVSDGLIARVVAQASKEQMQQRLDPNEPAYQNVVRTAKRPVLDYFSAEDRAFLQRTTARHLRHDFGYDYQSERLGPVAAGARSTA